MKNDHDRFWERVNAALDDRHDPLADEAVQAWIGRHPEDLETVLRLSERLKLLSAPPRARRRRAMPVRLAAAALVLFVGLAVLLRPSPPGEAPHVVARPDVEPRPTRFHELRLVVRTTNGTNRTTTTWSLEDGERTTELVHADSGTRLTTRTRGGSR